MCFRSLVEPCRPRPVHRRFERGRPVSASCLSRVPWRKYDWFRRTPSVAGLASPYRREPQCSVDVRRSAVGAGVKARLSAADFARRAVGLVRCIGRRSSGCGPADATEDAEGRGRMRRTRNSRARFGIVLARSGLRCGRRGSYAYWIPICRTDSRQCGGSGIPKGSDRDR